MKNIIILYSQGSKGIEQKFDSILDMPPIIKSLNSIKINNHIIKTINLNLSVKGFTRYQEIKFYNQLRDNYLDTELLKHWSGTKRMNIMLNEIKKHSGNIIILAGHSAGAWDSLILKSKYSNLIHGVIAFQPARVGKIALRSAPSMFLKFRDYQIQMMDGSKLNNTIIYQHDKDQFETNKTFHIDSDQIKYVDLSHIKTTRYHKLTLSEDFKYYKYTLIDFITNIMEKNNGNF